MFGVSETQIASSLMIPSYRIPCITAYNRLEPSPRALNFDRSLKAEVRDPLWMLTRQWQFGEFQGEDAGSPVTAQILGTHTMMHKIKIPSGREFDCDESIPLETVVERETLVSGEPVDPAKRPGLYVFLAVQIARHFFKLMKLSHVDNHLNEFLGKYKLPSEFNPNDQEVQQLLRAVSGTLFDGYVLYQDMTSNGVGGENSQFMEWIDAHNSHQISAAHKEKFKELETALIHWFKRSYSQPQSPGDSCWLPEQLEYSFSVSSSETQDRLIADQYCQGHLDWYSFDHDAKDSQQAKNFSPQTDVSKAELLTSFIPSPIAFKGMPNARFWTMEESQTNFGKIDTSTTGLLHLLYAEFGLVYSNDWFMLPYPLAVNTLCEILGIMITDVFGHHFFIQPAGAGLGSDWQRWTIFHHSERIDPTSCTNSLYVPPALTATLEGEPLEKVSFLRDETANMVWAVEDIIPSQVGRGVKGNEIAARNSRTAPFESAEKAKLRYVLGTTVPDNWTPFVPVHITGSETEIRLQRARMPFSSGPLGTLLREKPTPYFVNEEEVPRAGVIVQRSFQRARWSNGKSFLWIGRYKEAGKGEGGSNLTFDQIRDIP